jgi:hypothetical protein
MTSLDLQSSLDIGGNTLTVSGAFQNTGTLYRNGSGESAPRDNDSGTVVYRLTAGGTIQTYAATLANKDYNILEIESGSFSLTTDLMVLDTLNMSGGTLSAGSHTITLEGTFDSRGGAFTAGTSELAFDNTSGSYPVSYVWGSNTFYRFTCNVANKEIRFEATETQSIAAGGALTVDVVDATERVTFRSTAPNPGADPLPTDFPPMTNNVIQWGLDVSPSAVATIYYIYVELGFAFRPIVPVDITYHAHDWTYNWLSFLLVSGSWTGDAPTADFPLNAITGNGKVDRLMVTVSIPGVQLNTNFNDLEVYVDGYGTFTDPSDFTTGTDAFDNVFYILLPENDRLDTDASTAVSNLRWWITNKTYAHTGGSMPAH